jgi:hypothetical protein
MAEEIKKPCKECGVPKLLDEFYNHKGGKYGKGSVCKACKDAKNSQWKNAHPEKISHYNKKFHKKWYPKNRERKLANNKERRQKNPEKHRQYSKQYRKAHLQELRLYYQTYYYANQDRELEVDKKWNKANPDKVRARNRRADTKKYFEKHPEKVYARAVVALAVKYGKLPPARTLQCVDCDSQAEDYHHHKGYDFENWLEVVPMCRTCHGKTRRKH